VPSWLRFSCHGFNGWCGQRVPVSLGRLWRRWFVVLFSGVQGLSAAPLPLAFSGSVPQRDADLLSLAVIAERAEGAAKEEARKALVAELSSRETVNNRIRMAITDMLADDEVVALLEVC
jgi:hypothetical protein